MPFGNFGGIAGRVANPLSFISAKTVFGTLVDITLSVECFYPGDDGTRTILMRQAVQNRAQCLKLNRLATPLHDVCSSD